MTRTLPLLALLSCATAEPEPTPERPPVVCGEKTCEVDRDFLDSMGAHLQRCLEENESLQQQRPAFEVRGIQAYEQAVIP